ncbi:MAG: B12-binding domain-containing radical SAM protein [Desulfobacterales bacterium]|nr:B12-binding domain-containing radical SAM protein [Desulfobacterales bacterium]
MRVLLINPHYPISETPSPPLGLAYLAGALEAAGAEVEILDFVVYPYSPAALESALKRFGPRMVGVTAVTMTIHNAMEVVEEVKRIDPDIRTVMGGPHVTFCARETMTLHPRLDFIVRGEGESALVALVRALEKGEDGRGIPGVAHRDGAEIIDAGHCRASVDMDALPAPARDLIPLGRYRALGMPVSMTASRGCPFNCIFCVGKKMLGARSRRRDPGAVVDELAGLARLNFHQINMADDLFTANPTHCLAVCDEILRRGLQVGWTAFARVDTVSFEILSRMKDAGCHTVSFGVESGNPEMLKRIKKGITRSQVVDAVKICKDAGVDPHASFILGLPGETPDTMAETIAFGERLKEMGVSHGFHVLAPFPGTEIRENPERYDLKILTDDWSLYHANRAVAETAAVNREMLDDVVIGFEKKFDAWLGRLARRRRSGEADETEAWPLTRLEHTVYMYDLMMAERIEKNGSWIEEDGPVSTGSALETLADRVWSQSGRTREEILNTLTFAESSGSLKLDQKDQRVKWEWVDYL